MTREEAIAQLELTKKAFICNYADEYILEALDMAIKALEQQPCEDCISRQAVHDLIAELLSDYLHDEDREKIQELDVKIEDLPSVTPKEKTAAWVPIDEEPHEIYECNACGWLLYEQDRTDFKYCPNCGARMVSE